MIAEPVCIELNDGFRSPETAATSAAAEGVIRGIGEDMVVSLFGLGSGLCAFSIVGVPIRVGFENSFIFEPSFFSFPVLTSVGVVYCGRGCNGVRASA